MKVRARLLLFAAGAAGTAAVFTAGTLGLPAFGGAVHPYGDRAVEQALRQGTSNAVASVTFDQRVFDTLGEEIILLAAAVGAVVLLRVVSREAQDEGGSHRYGPAEVSDALRIVGYLLLPLTLVAGVYIVAHGHQSPGGGFQGGVVLGTAIHLLYLAGDYPALQRLRPIPLFESAEAVAAAAFAVLALAAAGQAAAGRVPALNTAVGVEVGCAMVLLLGRFFQQALLVRDGGPATRTGPRSGTDRRPDAETREPP
ncbi:MnhB domain-containing protein [Actinomadura sp. 7K507]|uniref:MnhB domain-containing protein n=1 Tax=Actinomadura sp. 7K507 TaxID=2530365 RepID=UPI00104B1C1A|nr:MnhB domain-containing protein [Actinomadura sp. 7K507]TDC76389.1 sodium:proton antiporter [Actinomadura sp. 7K507]